MLCSGVLGYAREHSTGFCRLCWPRWTERLATQHGVGEYPRICKTRLTLCRIFIMEGCLTIAISFLSYFFIVPFPEHCTFLLPADKALLLARLKADGGDIAQDDPSDKRIFNILRDWKIWAATAVYVGAAENANSIVNFQPTIIKGLGYKPAAAQVRTIPVYICAMLFSITMAYSAEYVCKRYLFCMIGFCTIVIGLIVELAQPPAAGVRYMGLFFISAGAYLVMPLSVVWIAVNVGRGYERSVALGTIYSIGNLGSFVGTNVFLKREEPTFRTGFSTNLGIACMGMAAATILFGGMLTENRRRTSQRKETLNHHGAGDPTVKHPDFRYNL
jgi:hypothetical protein